MKKRKSLNFNGLRYTVSKMRVELTRPIGHYPLKVARLPIPPPGQKSRAKDGTRTRDPDLGKVVLYQLSYFRINLVLFPVPTLVKFKERERKTGLGPATPTLARSCSTN